MDTREIGNEGQGQAPRAYSNYFNQLREWLGRRTSSIPGNIRIQISSGKIISPHDFFGSSLPSRVSGTFELRFSAYQHPVFHLPRLMVHVVDQKGAFTANFEVGLEGMRPIFKNISWWGYPRDDAWAHGRTIVSWAKDRTALPNERRAHINHGVIQLLEHEKARTEVHGLGTISREGIIRFRESDGSQFVDCYEADSHTLISSTQIRFIKDRSGERIEAEESENSKTKAYGKEVRGWVTRSNPPPEGLHPFNVISSMNAIRLVTIDGHSVFLKGLAPHKGRLYVRLFDNDAEQMVEVCRKSENTIFRIRLYKLTEVEGRTFATPID